MDTNFQNNFLASELFSLELNSNKQLKITNASKELYALAEFCGVEDVIND